MLDLAELTLTVSSSGVDEGTRSLQALERAAVGAEQASQKFATLSEKAWGASSKAIRGAADAARLAAASFKSMGDDAMRMHNLRAKFDDVYKSAYNLEMEIRDLAEAERLGVQITGGYSRALDGLILKHDKAAAAAAKQVRIYKQLAAAERLAATSADSQSRYNAAAGISLGTGKSARDSASVFRSFEQDLERMNNALGKEVARNAAAARREYEQMASAAERLRGQINPLHAAQSRLNDELQHYNTLAKGGYITTEELAKAQTLAQNQYQITAKALNEQGVAYANNRAQMANTINITHQLQDVAVTAAMGMNPLTIALQQGTQAAAAFHGAKPAEAVSMLVGAFRNLLSPTSLITVGLIALTAATIQWAMSSVNSTKEAKKALDDYRNSVDALTKSYEKNAEQSRIQAEAAERLARSRLQSSVLEQVRSGLNQTGVQDVLSGWRYWSQLLSGMGTLDSIESVFQPFNKELQVLQQGLAESRPDLEAFESSVVATAESLRGSVPNIEIYRDRLLEMFGIASDGARALDPATIATNRLTAAQKALSNAVDNFDPHGVGGKLGAIQDRVEGLVRQFNAGQISVGELSNRLNTIPDASGALKPTIDSVKTLAAEAWKAYVAASMLAEALPLAPKGDRLQTTQQRMDAAAEEFKKQYELWRRMNPDAFELTDKIDARKKSYDDLIESSRAHIDLLRQEISWVGKSGLEVEALKFKYDLLEEARRGNISIGPEEQAGIDKLTESYRKFAEELAELRALDDIAFEWSLIGLSDGDKEILTFLRQIGVEVDSVRGQNIAAEMRYNQVLQETQDELKALHDIGKNAFTNLLDLLYETGDTGEKLIGIFAGIGKQFAQMGMERLWKSISGQASSQFDPIAALFGGGSGGGAGGYASVTSAASRIENSVSNMSDTMSVASDDLAGNIRRAAGILGTSAHDLATVISFETGGTFSTSVRGGVGNRHIGLIQFGPAEQQKYGAAIGQTLTDQFDAVIRYLQDRGFKPGMSGLDLYSTINAGGPGLYDRSDAANGGTWGTVADKWNLQMGSHRANAEKVLSREAVREGTIDAAKRLAANDNWDGLRTVTAAGGPKNNLESMLGVGSAAIGAFAGGYQSGSPLMGGISGAMSGLGAASSIGSAFPALAGVAGPLGLIAGGLIGVIGGIFGKSSQKKEQRKQAQDQLAKQQGAIDNLLAVGEGTGIGENTQAWRKYYDEVQEVTSLAWKAGDMQLVKRVQSAFNQFFDRLYDDYQNSFEGMIESLSMGHGSSSPFLQAADEVTGLRESLLGMIADAEEMNKKHLELVMAAEDDWKVERMAEQIRAVTEAAQEMALSVLTGAKELSSMETEVMRIEGAASALQVTLEQLGKSAEEAASAIESGTIQAMDKLRNTFMTDVSLSMAGLADMDFIGELVSAHDMYTMRLRDFAALGLDASIATQELNLRLDQIASQAELTDDQLRTLAGAFPQLSDGLLALIGGAGGSSLSLDTAKADLDEAKDNLRSAYEKEKSALEQVISRHDSFVKSLRRFLDDLRLDSQLSPLDPFQRLQEAQRQFQETAALALTGDEDAMGRLEDTSRAYLTEARAYYATSETYFRIFEEVEGILDQALSMAGNQLSEAEQQLKALEALVSPLLDINDSVLTVAAAIEALTAAQLAMDQAEAAHKASQVALLQQILSQLAATGATGYDPTITRLYQETVGRTPDAEGHAFWLNHLDQGYTTDQIRQLMLQSPEYRALQGFSAGGFTGMLPTNAVAGVVHGQEFVAHAEATRRWRPQLEAMNAGGNPFGGGQDTSALKEEIRLLRQELREAIQQNTQVTAAGAQMQVAATQGTTQAVNRQADGQWRKSKARAA